MTSQTPKVVRSIPITIGNQTPHVGWGIPILIGVIVFTWLSCSPKKSAVPGAVGSGGSSGIYAASEEKEIAWMQAAESAVRERLTDPSSARFSGAQVHYFQGVPVACGYVNAKNSFGGYAGTSRYIYGGGVGTFIETDMAPGEMSKAWAQVCR